VFYPHGQAVMIGKGDPRQALTQNGPMVSDGKRCGDQTKTANASCLACVRYGNGW